MSEESKKGLSRRKFVVLTGGAVVASGILAACGDNTPTTAPATTAASSGYHSGRRGDYGGQRDHCGRRRDYGGRWCHYHRAGAATTCRRRGHYGRCRYRWRSSRRCCPGRPAGLCTTSTTPPTSRRSTSTSRSTSAAARSPTSSPIRWCAWIRTSRSSPARPPSGKLNSTGLVWTFHLDPNLMWSDDTPVTADDYVATFQYGADPKHAWDFTWFFGGVIKNWNEAVAGKVPLDQLGVKAADAHTFQVTTEARRPTCPAMMLYSDPAEEGACGARRAVQLRPGDLGLVRPVRAQGVAQGRPGCLRGQPQVQGHQQAVHPEDCRIGAAPSTDFASYQAGEIDFVGGSNLSPGRQRDHRPGPRAEEGNPPAAQRLPHRLPVLRHQEPAVQQHQGAPGVQPCRGPRRADQADYQAAARASRPTRS